VVQHRREGPEETVGVQVLEIQVGIRVLGIQVGVEEMEARHQPMDRAKGLAQHSLKMEGQQLVQVRVLGVDQLRQVQANHQVLHQLVHLHQVHLHQVHLQVANFQHSCQLGALKVAKKNVIHVLATMLLLQAIFLTLEVLVMAESIMCAILEFAIVFNTSSSLVSLEDYSSELFQYDLAITVANLSISKH